jgi:hypothetical protein
MIGQPNDVCLFEVCDSTRTKYYRDDFNQIVLSKTSARMTTVNRSGIALCQRHVDEIVHARQTGQTISISGEGWVYIDDWAKLITTN